MVPSVDARILVVAALLVLVPLSGCTTTQQKSTRAKVVANRLLASRKPMLVRRVNHDVTVESVMLVRGRAVVVRVRNPTARVVEDLPVSVGLRPRHWLNRRGGLDYLGTHIAAIGPRATVTWVFTTARRVRGRPVARVGIGAPVSPPPRVPAVRAVLVGASAPVVTARVTNSSSIPQYGLGVYAVGRRAAGRAVIRRLGTGESTTVRIPVIGDPKDLQLETAPSTLR